MLPGLLYNLHTCRLTRLRLLAAALLHVDPVSWTTLETAARRLVEAWPTRR